MFSINYEDTEEVDNKKHELINKTKERKKIKLKLEDLKKKYESNSKFFKNIHPLLYLRL